MITQFTLLTARYVLSQFQNCQVRILVVRNCCRPNNLGEGAGLQPTCSPPPPLAPPARTPLLKEPLADWRETRFSFQQVRTFHLKIPELPDPLNCNANALEPRSRWWCNSVNLNQSPTKHSGNIPTGHSIHMNKGPACLL